MDASHTPCISCRKSSASSSTPVTPVEVFQLKVTGMAVSSGRDGGRACWQVAPTNQVVGKCILMYARIKCNKIAMGAVNYKGGVKYRDFYNK